MKSKLDRKLWDRGYLFENRSTELHQSHMLYSELIKFHRDLQCHQIAIIPTYTCNFKCVYCWQDRQKLPSKVMDSEIVTIAFQAIDQLVKGIDPNQVVICLFGGEPLQVDNQIFNAVKCIIDKSKRRNFRLNAITNGVYLREYLPVFGNSLDAVQVTLDGPAEVHERRRIGKLGDFWRIIESIDHAVNKGIEVNIRVNVAPENLKSIPELSQFIENRWGKNGPNLYLSPVKGQNNGLQYNEITSLQELFSMYGVAGIPQNVSMMGYRAVRDIIHLIKYDKMPMNRFFSCEAQLNFWALDSAGDVYACFDACGNQKLSVGRFIPDLELEELRLRVWRDRSSLNHKRCIMCAAAPVCSAGCAYVASSQDKISCNRLVDAYPIAIKYFAKAIYDKAAIGESKTIGFINA